MELFSIRIQRTFQLVSTLFKGVQNNHIFTQMEILNPQIKEM